jgi:signal transduction histidine kinase/CheY-like chemotaxis protein
MFKNVSVWKKLLFAFLLIVLIFIVSIGLTLWQTVNIHSRVKQITNIEEPLQTATLEMEINLGKATRAVSSYIRKPDIENVKKLRDAEYDYEQTAMLLAKLMPHITDKKMSEKISDLFVVHQVLGNKLIKLVDHRQQRYKSFFQQMEDADGLIENELKQLKQTNVQSLQKEEAALEFEVNLHEIASYVLAYLIHPDPELRALTKNSQKDFSRYAKQFRALQPTPKETLLLENIDKKYSGMVEDVYSLMDNEDALRTTLHEFEQHLKKISELMRTDVRPLTRNSIVMAVQSAERAGTDAFILVIISGLIGIFAAIFIVWWLSRQLIVPITKLKQATEAYIAGDKSVKIDAEGKDELGDLSLSFNNLITNINELTSKAEERSWLKTEVARISSLAQEKSELRDLAQTVIGELANAVQAGYGAFYLKEESASLTDAQEEKERKAVLMLFGSYAYKERKNLSNRIKFGEGLVGQCAIEQKPILLTKAPSNYIVINSGLGEKKPINIIVLPLVFEKGLLGVVELASFEPFSPLQQDMLEQTCIGLSASVNSLLANAKTENLLVESRHLAEELQSQQEELKTTNEELEEKTRVLKESEHELKAQSEELQSANEELEEKTEYLGRQKADIEEKNKKIGLASEEVERKAKDLEMASKYKSEFLANMSHELRTPLNSLLLLSKTFADNSDGNLTDKQIEAADVIYSGGKELLTLINDILDLSKVEAGKLEIITQSFEVAEVVGLLKQQFDPVSKEKGVDFIIEVAEGVPEIIRQDDRHLAQIIKNFLSNAFKFTSQGSVTLKVAKPADDAVFRDTSLNREAALAFSVIDTGIGIPDDKKEPIFEAFQQADGGTSRTYGGTGLGLAISRELAKLLGGEVQLHSKEGEGSTFTLFIPFDYKNDKGQDVPPTSVPEKAKKMEAKVSVSQEKPPAPFLPDDRDNINKTSNSILIIEDDKKFAKLLADVSREKGYLCLITDRGKTGLQLAAEYQPKAIILDMGLPDVDGAHVLELLKFDGKTRHIPVHIISARDESPALKQKGAIGYLHKPADQTGIDLAFNKIESILDNKIKKVLVVEDDINNQKAIARLIENDVQVIEVTDQGKEAKKKIMSEHYDCVILDLSLPDISGFDLLKELNDEKVELPPVVIYTGRELTAEEHAELSRYSASIVVKGADSPERLFDEVSLFLHSVEAKLPDEQKKMMRKLHNIESVLMGRKILLVDDDMRNVFALSGILEDHGLTVVVASDGQLALDKLDSIPDIELVLMDVMMPVMDGYEAIQKVREKQQFKTLPIIALTAKAMMEDRDKCMQAGASDYLTKPVDIDQLLSMLKVWLSK